MDVNFKCGQRICKMDGLEHIGQIVGDYRLLRWLGGGGFGNVYLAEELSNGQQVAVKVLQVRLTKKDDLRAFITEARTIRLRHPHILPLLDFGLSRKDAPFLVMEYAPQGTLRDRHPKGTRIALPQAVEYASQIASALQYAHDARLVHRDVKPENMLVRADGQVLLSDFGIATTVQSSSSLQSHQGTFGTPSYMAPEQLRGQPRAASDQYALAVVLYEWLSGRILFKGTALEVAMQHATQPPAKLSTQTSGISQEIENILFKALAKDYKDRFSSMDTFLSALQQTGVPTSPRSRALKQSTGKKPAMPPTIFPPRKEQAHTITAARVQSSPSQPSKSPSQPLKEQHGTTSGKDLKAFAAGISSQEYIVPTPQTPSSMQHLAGKRRLPRSMGALLLLLIVLLIAGGGYLYTTATVAHRNTTNAIATHQNATDATATVQPIDNPYNDAVAQNGIMSGFDPAHTHNNPYEYVLSSTNVKQLHQKWMILGDHGDFTSPTIANNVVYVGSNDYRLYAFNATSGQQLWATSTSDSIYSTPAVVNGIVYVGSFDDNLYAFDATTGQQLWASPTGGSVESSPTVVNGVVYIGSQDNKLYAFNATSGKQLWSAPTGGSVNSSPAVANNIVYVGSQDNRLYAFNATSGKQLWTAPTGSSVESSPAIANGIVYVGSEDNNLYAFKATTGQQLWTTPTGDGISSSPAIANGIIYIGSHDHNLYAFDATTGKQLWSALTGNNISAATTIANGVVYVGSLDSKLYAFKATTGQQLWTTSTGDAISSDPTIANGIVYISTTGRSLYAFSL